MSIVQAPDKLEEQLRRRSFRLRFNGSLSLDEARMMGQGIGREGSDYEALLHAWDDVEEVLEA